MEPLLFSGHRGPIYALAHALDAGGFYSGSSDGMVVHWNTATPDAGSSLVDVGQAIFSLCTLPDRGFVIVGTEGGDLHVVDQRKRAETQLIKAHTHGLFRIRSLPDQRLACAGGDGALSIWSTKNGRLDMLRQIPLSESKLRDLALSPNGEHLAVACGDGTIRILDTLLFNELFTLQANASNDLTSGEVMDGALLGMSALAYHPTKAVLISGGKDGVLRSWQSSDRYRQLLHFPAHKGTVYTIAFNADGTRCATASRDKSAKVWAAVDFAPLSRLDRVAGGHTHSVNTVLWCGSTLLTGSDDRRILGWPDA